MFAEEEDWSDGTEVHDTSKPIVNIHDDRKTVKSKGVAKKSLLRTLQTLGSVPDWINGDQGNASDSETDNVPVHTKRKKKRSKRRRKAASTEESAQDGNVTQTAIKVQPTEPMEKRIAIPAGTSKVMLTESKNVTGQDTKCVQLKRDSIEKLNRQQWRNKIKMKRKCVNKYRPSEGPKKDVLKPEAAKEYKAGESLKVSSDTNETDASQTSLPLKKSTQTERQGKARKGNKADESNNITPIFDTQTRKKDLSKKSKLNSKGKTSEPEPPVRLCDSQEAANKEKQVIPIKKPKLELNDAERRKRETLRRLLQDKVQRSKESPTELQHDEVAQEATPNRSTALRSRMEQRLESARFRYINEVLYTSTSGEAKRMFKQDPHAFGIYHRGFTAQVQRWPANPVDAIISYIRQKPPSLVVADFGCGDCKIARSVKNKVHSFDLAQVCDLVTVCDMAHVPLDDCTVDIAVFCLSLMGTNLVDFLAEANRVLVMGGVLKVAEVASRFENTRSFLSTLAGLGFKLVSKDTKNSHFLSFDFEKSGDCPENTKKAGLELRPCVYKKR